MDLELIKFHVVPVQLGEVAQPDTNPHKSYSMTATKDGNRWTVRERTIIVGFVQRVNGEIQGTLSFTHKGQLERYVRIAQHVPLRPL